MWSYHQVRGGSEVRNELPQSRMTSLSSASSVRLPGLMSLCTRPMLCTYCRAMAPSAIRAMPHSMLGLMWSLPLPFSGLQVSKEVPTWPNWLLAPCMLAAGGPFMKGANTAGLLHAWAPSGTSTGSNTVTVKISNTKLVLNSGRQHCDKGAVSA